LDLSGQNLKYVLEDDLSMFSKLQILRAGENQLPFARLGVLPSLRKLIFPCNGLTSLDLDVEGRFSSLEVLYLTKEQSNEIVTHLIWRKYLDVSYNSVDESAILVLATLPSLEYLDLTRNNLHNLPETLKDMTKWRDRVIEFLLPDQVAELDAVNGSFDRPPSAMSERYNRETPRELVSMRSFSRSMSKPGSARPDMATRNTNRSEANHRSQSPIEKRLKSPLTVGFPCLRKLVLEGNKLRSFDVFHILGNLKQ
jgi:Leucine-rich repeat (LRR) protein